MSGKCGICQQPATLRCSGCRQVFYCSRDHQKQHWKAHKASCQLKPYIISHSDVLGRYLVAAKDIQPGEIIMREKPFLLGPKVISLPLCLGCHRSVSESNSKCSGCHWPVCGAACERSLHHVEECQLLRERGFQVQIKDFNKKEAAYCCITPLRCLLLKNADKSKWETLLSCESHLEERSKTPLYAVFKTNVVGFIRNVLQLDEFDEEMILRICAILDTNTFDVRRSDGSVRVRGIYPNAALMSHDCTPNTKHSFDDADFSMTVTVTVAVKAGDVISTTYSQTLWETISRRAHLRSAKCFDCTCNRCSDPTELGTYIGAINCLRCRKGKIMSTKPLDSAAEWICDLCSHVMTAAEVKEYNESLRKEIASLDKSGPKPMEKFLDKYKDLLHNTNTHIIEIKYALIQLYGNRVGNSTKDLSDVQLMRKVELCNDVLKVANILDPGSSRLRGFLLWDLQTARRVLIERDSSSKSLPLSTKRIKLEEVMKSLQQAIIILKGEPGMKEKMEEEIASLKNNLVRCQ